MASPALAEEIWKRQRAKPIVRCMAAVRRTVNGGSGDDSGEDTMNWLINCLAVIALVGSAIEVVAGPFLIGYPRKPRTAEQYVAVLLEAGGTLCLCGRVLGWW